MRPNGRAHVNLALGGARGPGTEAKAEPGPAEECGHRPGRRALGFQFHLAWEAQGVFSQSWLLPGPWFSPLDFGYSHAHLACPLPQPLKFGDRHMGSLYT